MEHNDVEKIYPKDFEIVMKYIGNLIKVCQILKLEGWRKTTRQKKKKKIIHINGRGIAH